MKVLITADVHIDDYADYNYEYRSRLKQFNTLAHRIIEIAKQYDCKEHWILGDIINRPNSRKYIEHAAKRFLKIQSNHFDTVRYILGQHDRESKSQDFDIEDTLITLFDFDNFIYMDRKLLEVDGHVFGFMNWLPEQDLDWLGDKHLDVLFGHYTKSTLFGQEIDEDKFDLMIHGDIHNRQVIGKFISVCNPIQHDLRSEANGDVIIFDTETLEWFRVDTDPDHTRFLRISYTDKKELGGFSGPLQYNVYRPAIESVTDSQKKTITWNDVDDLIKNTCKELQLTAVHGEVESNCVPYSEVDFNFQVTHLKIHGYRSIEDLELDFTTGDRVALLGDNGSGKSSIVRALQGVFSKNSYLKYEQSDFTDDLLIEVTITYQNKVYKITKGSRWGLLIDGQEQSYSGIREFEDDLPNKLPFIEYLDLMFMNSNVNDLSSQFTPTRRIELISKFYRLDRIQAYQQTANNLWKAENDKRNGLKSQLDIEEGMLTKYRSRLTELEATNLMSADDINSEIKSLNDLRTRYQDYQSWSTLNSELETQTNSAQQSVDKLTMTLNFDINQGKKDLVDLEDKLTVINTTYEDQYKKSVEFESLLKEITLIESQGKGLSDKLGTLSSGRCPECDAPLSEGKSKELIQNTQKQLDESRSKWVELDSKLGEHPKGRESKAYYLEVLSGLKEGYKTTKDGLELLRNKIRQYELSKSKLDSEIERLNNLKSRLEEHKLTEPEKVVLPLDLDDKISTLYGKLNLISELDRVTTDVAKQSESIESLKSQLADVQVKLDNYERYIEITSMNGIIYEQILIQLAEKFTTTEVKYAVDSGVYRGSRFINFNSFYLVKNNYRLYETCSDGQRTICDLDFLDKLFSTQVGILVLDEYLKKLDDKNFPKACEIITSMNANTVILSTHDNNLSVYSKRLLLSLDDTGRTSCLKM